MRGSLFDLAHKAPEDTEANEKNSLKALCPLWPTLANYGEQTVMLQPLSVPASAEV